MEIDIAKPKQIIGSHAMPKWANRDEEWSLRPGGGEAYVQDDVLRNAAPHLTEDELRRDAKQAVLDAINARNNNLLSPFDKMFAKIFIDEVSNDELTSHMLSLLFGTETLEFRLRRFLEWAKVKPIRGEKRKKGFSPMVASYFLAMSNPREYPYCKPVAHNAAVVALIGKTAKKSDRVERILQCQQLYSTVLDISEREYGLQDGNLLDVHSLFYLFQAKGWTPDGDNGGGE